MTTLYDPLDEDAVWEQLRAEWHARDERVRYAVTFYQLMHQRAPLGIPVQYERLFLRTRDRKEETSYDHARRHQQSHPRRRAHTRG